MFNIKNKLTMVVRCSIVLGLALFAMAACDSNSSSSNGVGGTGQNGGATSLKVTQQNANKAPVPMNIAWSLDGFNIASGYNLNDMAWHLITLTVVDQTTPLNSPVALKGLQAVIYPATKEKRGQTVEVQDINCANAIFSKNGDTCSAYIRAYYDTNTGLSNPPTISVQVATNAYPELSALLAYYVKPFLDSSRGDYRNILPIENRYYVGSAVKAHPYQYQILNMRNISFPALTINQISNLTNPAFKLMQRKNDSSDDPYYGPYSQCSLTENASLNQVNSLPGFESECLLVYEAAATANNSVERSSISLGTTAIKTAPWGNNVFSLIANYDNDQSDSTFPVTFSSEHLDDSPSSMISNQALSKGYVKTDACGGAWASSAASITPDPRNTNSVILTMNNNSNGNCGIEAPEYFEANIPLNGYNQTVYSVNQWPCGNGNWDIGGMVSVTGKGCDGDHCEYSVNVTASHGGVGNQCRDRQTRSFELKFNRPQLKLKMFRCEHS